MSETTFDRNVLCAKYVYEDKRKNYEGDEYVQTNKIYIAISPDPCCKNCYFFTSELCCSEAVTKTQFKPRFPEEFFCSRWISPEDFLEKASKEMRVDE